MFTFHKPRVYRSTEGCCICRAKSSSSRFTDSKKYENDSMKCFNLKQPRFGEICNACVLLVKRYKRLPAGSNRHWGHVVDARTGPGTKSLTKYKKYKEDTDCATGGHQTTYSSKSFITEKFSKIFKKNKKSKTNVSPSLSSSSSSCSSGNSKRKSATASSPTSSITTSTTQPWENHHHHNLQHPSLPSTPDSIDSDYEDSHMLTPSSTTVEFQTQTRASAFRSRNSKSSNTGCTISSLHRRRAIKLSGSLRRKCMPPRKLLRAIFENDVQFFDENEWQKRPSCCGPVYECEVLGGAIIIDLDQYKPCALHQKKSNATEVMQNQAMIQQTQQIAQKTIITTMPAVVQLAAATATTPTHVSDITKPTQVLKKHHLFFKRQSECFPHADLSEVNTINNDKTLMMTTMTTTPTPAIKTDLHNSTSTTTTTAISLKSISTDLASSTNLSLSAQALTNTNTLNPRHSMAKITTISSANTIVSNNYNTNSTKSTNFLHKIKAAETGKIVKNSLEKINTTVRLKPCEFNDMRNIIKTVDKSFVLNKSYSSQQISAQPVTHQQQQQQQIIPHHANISIVGPAINQQIANSTISSALSPTLSTSTISSLAPKFSDNSSDSGFDENLQDRKSASPLQEDTEKKMLTRPNISNSKKLYLTAGVNFYGPSQSMLLSGIDEAVNLRQKSRQQTTSAATTSHQRNHQNRLSNGGGGVKIAQIVNSSAGSGSHKMHMRALYNNNTIKHENGVTTILPASSLAASSQTAAMSALVAPSTVTITPAPTAGSGAINNINGKKVAITCTAPQNTNPHSNVVPAAATTHLNTISNQSVSSLNQKIIFVKTAKYGNNHNNSQQASFHGSNSSSNNKSSAAAAAMLNNVISQTQSVCKN